jgi:hypothetical protein
MFEREKPMMAMPMPPDCEDSRVSFDVVRGAYSVRGIAYVLLI